MKSKILFVIGLVLLLTPLTTVALAAPSSQAVTCEEEYVVQADDWLSKLANRYYGDMFAYPAIVVATNLVGVRDDSFTLITDPDVIEIGQKVCIPPADEVEDLVAAFGGTEQVPGPPAEQKRVWVHQVDIQLVDGEYKATIIGDFPDGCSTLGEVETAVDGDTIIVTVFADSPPGASCASVLVPFEETITLNVSEIQSGDYTVVVNEFATTTLTIN